MRTRRNRYAAGKSTKRRGRLWGTRDVDRGCGCGENSLPRSNYAARAGRASPHPASKTSRAIYFWNYAKGTVKTSGEGRQLTPIYDTSDINAPVNINAMYTRRALTFFH